MAVVSCPVGGISYTCATINPTFLGCCDINPCHNGHCPPASLFPMGLGDKYTYVPGHSCPNGGQWWTCAEQKTTFQGCCATDPCNGIGCPTLIAAGLQTNTPQTAPADAVSPSDLESTNAADQPPACTRRSSALTTTSIASDSTSTGSFLTKRGPRGSHRHHAFPYSGTGSVGQGTSVRIAVFVVTAALIIFSFTGITS